MKVATLAAALLCVATSASAQAPYTAGHMWGTSANPPGSPTDSALGHKLNGDIAAQALAGKNITTDNIFIEANGVKNVTSIQGDGNTINGTQAGTNSGEVSAKGKFGKVK